MKRFIFILFAVLAFQCAKAQDNPFEELGYTPRFATLSGGKYQEFHDNDTIVNIGSVLLNTKTKEIVGFIEYEVKYSEATLQPDIVSRWISPDPLAEKYMSISPYVYVANNPIIFVDPDGRDIVLAGDNAKAAFKQLKSSTNLKLKMDRKTRKVTVTGTAKTDADKKLMQASTNSNIIVEINAISETTVNTSNGEKRLQGGAFLGSTVNEDGTVTAKQTLNPDQTKTIDDISGQEKGTTVLHEVLEAYIGAEMDPGSNDATNSDSIYQAAHDTTNEILENSSKKVNPKNAIITTNPATGKTTITNEDGKKKDLN